MNQPTDDRINELAAEAARHVQTPHNAAAQAHNTRAIAHAIRLYGIEAGLLPEPVEPAEPPHTCSIPEGSTVCEICGS